MYHTTPQNDLLTLEQIAALLGCSTRAIYSERVRGVFPEPIRVGKRLVRWPRSAIESYLANQ